MTSRPHTPAFRTPRLGLLLAAAGALLAVAIPAYALPTLPGVSQGIDTPAGRIDASADGNGAAFCSDLATPALPALPAAPALPVPIPVAVPAVPNASANADACASAGLDGASAEVGIDSAAGHADTGIDAKSPVSQDDVDGLADEATGNAKGFFEGFMDTLFGWM